jgi:hypothetical protein
MKKNKIILVNKNTQEIEVWNYLKNICNRYKWNYIALNQRKFPITIDEYILYKIDPQDESVRNKSNNRLPTVKADG